MAIRGDEHIGDKEQEHDGQQNACDKSAGPIRRHHLREKYCVTRCGSQEIPIEVGAVCDFGNNDAEHRKKQQTDTDDQLFASEGRRRRVGRAALMASPREKREHDDKENQARPKDRGEKMLDDLIGVSRKSAAADTGRIMRSHPQVDPRNQT
jgi:hypothetical protein